MAKPKARKKQVVHVDESSMAELRSFLMPDPTVGRTHQVVPYLKSFRDENPGREIGTSILKYTACSSKKWTAPQSRPAKKVFA